LYTQHRALGKIWSEIEEQILNFAEKILLHYCCVIDELNISDFQGGFLALSKGRHRVGAE
jgi:hypothetical protein